MAPHPVPIPLPSNVALEPTVAHPIPAQFVGGLFVALLCVIVAALWGRLWKRSVRQATLPDGATWNFKDSWASNVTAALTGVGAVGIAVADKFPDIVAARSIQEFGVGMAMLGVVAVLAPIAYSAFSASPEIGGIAADRSGSAITATMTNAGGRVGGLLIAATLTLTAAFGSLIGALVLVDSANLDTTTKAWLSIACAAAVVLLVVYAVNSLRILLANLPKKDAYANGVAKLALLSGLITVSCCDSEPKASRIRISLL